MASKIVQGQVVGIPAFVGGVLHMPGETATLDLSELGNKDAELGDVEHVTSLNHRLVVGFDKPVEGEAIAIVPIAAVAPHVPEPSAPQGVPAGTIQSPTGRLMAPQGEGEPGQAREFAPSTADVQDGATAGKGKK